MKGKLLRACSMAAVLVLLVPILLVTVYAVTPISNIEVAASKNGGWSGGSINVSNGVVTITANGGQFLATTNDVTITNTSSVKCRITFDYSALHYGSFSEATAEGTISITLASKETYKMSITGVKALLADPATLTLSNFTSTPIYEGPVTITHNTWGSVTVGGAEVKNGATSATVPETGTKLVATPVDGASFVAWVNVDDNQILSHSASYDLIPYATSMNIEAIFTKADQAPFCKIGKTLYRDLNTALNTAASGSDKTVAIISDGTLPTGTLDIPSGVSLLLPYSGDDTTIAASTTIVEGGWKSTLEHANVKLVSGETHGNAAVANVLLPDKEVTYTLNIPAGTTVNVAQNAKLVVGGTVTSGHQYTAGIVGATAGAHSNVNLSGIINVNNGGILSSCGYILGGGQINVANNGRVYQPLAFMDHRDGHYVVASSNSDNVLPFNRFALVNIRCGIKMNSGSRMTGYGVIYTQQTMVEKLGVMVEVPERFNVDCLDMIGPSGAMINTSGTVDISYDPNRYANDTSHNSVGLYNRVGTTIVDISGGASLGSASLDVSVAGTEQSFDTAKNYFPVSYNYIINLKNGDYTIGNKLKLMPGAEIYVASDAHLTVSGGLAVLDGFRDHSARANSVTATGWSNFHYPSTAVLQASPMNGNGMAKLVVDGTMNVTGTFVGFVQTNGGGTITTGSDSTNSLELHIGANNTTTLLGMLNTAVTGKSVYNLNARIFTADGNIINMEPGKVYGGVDSNTHKVTEFTYKFYTTYNDNSKIETAKVALNATVTGSWKCADGSHTYTEESVTNTATCTEVGIKTSTCTACGDVKTEGSTALGHDLVAGAVTAPTCTTGGYTTYNCSRCDYSEQKDQTQATGHSYGDWTQTQAPTCTEKGVETRTCENDAAHKETREVNALGHDLKDVAGQAATCTEAGYTAYEDCSRCDYIEGKTAINALGHKDDNKDHACDNGCDIYQGTHADSATDGDHVCDYCGKEVKNGEVCSDVTTDKDHNCDVCGKKDVTTHSYTSVVTEPTCEAEGFTTYTCNCGDSYVADKVAAIDHSYSSEVTTAPTCTDKGVRTYTCANCGDTYTEEIAATGHDYGDWTVISPATCTAEGEETRICANDANHKETRKLDKVAHTPAAAVEENRKESTCTVAGSYESVVYCSVCKTHEISRTKVDLPLAEHTEGEAVVENKVDADYNNKGSYDSVVYCSVCNTELSRVKTEIPMLTGAVAEINGVKYGTLAEAVAAAENGATVKLLTDATGAGVVIDKDIIIDFGGYTYSFTEGVGSTGTESNGFQILKGNTVTLKNGTLNVAKEAADKFYILVQNYANLTVEDMTLDGTNLDKYSATDGDSYTLSNNSGTVNVTGETNIIANDEGDKAFAFDVCKSAAYEAPVVNVNTTDKITGKIEVSESIAENLNISGGTFTVAIGETWCAEGYVPAENTDGTYGVKVGLPKVEITDIKDTLTDNDPDLTFALNFAIADIDNLTEEYLEELFSVYGGYYVDYVLTIEGLTDPSVTFNADGDSDGYLAGQYDAFGTNWVTVPFEDVEIENGQSLYIMEYAAKLMGQSGLRFTLLEVAEIVQNFDCGVYFTPEFLAANPNMEVKLQLKVFTEDAEGNKIENIDVATNEFEAPIVVASVNNVGYATLTEAVKNATEGSTVTLLTDATGAGVVIDKSITIDFGDYTYTVNSAVGSAGTETLGFQILKGHDVTLKDGTLTSTAVTGGNQVKMLIQNYSDLTLTDMNLVDGTEHIQYVLSNNSGEIEVNGATNITTDAVAFDVYDYSAAGYDVPSMTVNTTGVISGEIEVSETATLAISGGSFTAQIDKNWCAEGYGPNLSVDADGFYGVHKHMDGEAEIENEIAPNCTTDGSYDTVICCSVCNTELSRETTVVPATGEHTAGEAKVENNVAPDCDTAGSYDNVVYCSVCSTELSRETITVPALGHTTKVDYGNGQVTISNADVAALKPTTFIQVIGTDILMDKINVCVEYVMENAADSGYIVRVYETEEFRQFLLELVGEEWLNAHTDAIETIRANAAVLYVAKLVEKGRVDLSILTAANGAEEIRVNMSKNPSEALAQMAMAHGMYVAYAYDSGDDTLIAGTDAPVHILANMNTDAYRAYVDDEKGQNDLEGFKAALRMAYGSTDSAEAVQKLLLNGFTDDDLVKIINDAVEGYKHNCPVCGEKLTDCVEKIIPGKDATCTEPGLTEGKICVLCGETLVEQEEIPALNHAYEAVVTAPNCTEQGYTTYTCACGESYVGDYVEATGEHNYVDGVCSVCGVAEVPVAEDLVFIQKGISSKSYIGLQTAIWKSAAENYDTVYMMANDQKIEGFEYQTYFIVFDKQVMAAEMSEEITLTLYGEKDGVTYKGESVTFSVASLAVQKIKEYEAKGDYAMCTMFADMLMYGSAAQRYRYNDKYTGQILPLADSFLGEYAKYATVEAPDLSYGNKIISDGKETVTAYTVSMSMQSVLEINLGFLNDVTDYVVHVTVNGVTETYAIEPYSTVYTARIPIGARNVRAEYTICVKTASGEQVSPTYICSAEGCAKDRMASSSASEALKNLMVAMMKYGDAVKEAYTD